MPADVMNKIKNDKFSTRQSFSLDSFRLRDQNPIPILFEGTLDHYGEKRSAILFCEKKGRVDYKWQQEREREHCRSVISERQQTLMRCPHLIEFDGTGQGT